MAILRAGPWGDLTDSFQNEPEDPTDINNSFYPVNCADKDWASGAVWQQIVVYDHYIEEPFPFYPLQKLVNQGEGATANYDMLSCRHWFCYQATADFDITLTWDYQPDYGDMIGMVYTDPYVEYIKLEDNIPVKTTTTASQTGSQSFTLPATTFARVEAFVGGAGPEFYTLTTTLG